ncbi:MAG: acetate/propionate family kinase [Burkholderiaceae bacterium]|nr:acetate/propionate family kinase [Burkholderiaceae bacterium]
MQPAPTARSAILAVNIGSSSVKFSVHPIQDVEGSQSVGASLLSGNIQGLEPSGNPFISWSNHGGPHREDLPLQAKEDGLEAALRVLRDLLPRELHGLSILAVAHRVVHGGEEFSKAVLVDDKILEQLHRLDPLAPLHQPHNLRGIAAFMQIFSGVPQVACFDTAFHVGIPRAEKTFPLTRELFQQGVRRYGFHGLSYHYVSSRLTQHTAAAGKRLLMAHLGNGSSLCACVGGKSFSTTMGFSAVGGLMMGTRCGDLDPGVVLYLVQQGYDAKALENLFYRQSGLKGLSGISADMRTLRASDADEARFAVEVYEHRVIREAGGLIAAMGGVDAIAFAGGIGENDRMLRADVCAGLGFLGLKLDTQANLAAPNDQITPIHAAGSSVEVWVVPTDEGIIAAEEALALL